MDAFVIEQVQRVLGGDHSAIEKAVSQFIKALNRRAQPDGQRGQTQAQLKKVQKRIDSVMALVSDGELDDMAELRETLSNLQKRRKALQSELDAADTNEVMPMSADELQAWAHERLDHIGEALSSGEANEALRQVVQAYVIRIDIEPGVKRGTLLLPADALAILERDATSFLRVKPVDTGFNAIKDAFFGNDPIALAVLDKENGSGLDADFMVTNFSRNEPLEEAITVSVTAKPTRTDRAPQWVDGSGGGS